MDEKPCKRDAYDEIEEAEETQKDNDTIQEADDTQKDVGSCSFEAGDHVFRWCSALGIPGVFQHHGVVLEVDRVAGIVTIADFNAVISDNDECGPVAESLSVSSRKQYFGEDLPSRMQRYAVDTDMSDTTWRKVRYSAPWHKRLLSRSGTCTFAEADPPGLAVSRAEFLIHNEHLIPPYHVLRSNCECVAVWCKTGRWATLQASSFLHATALSQVKSTAVVAGVAAGQHVAVTVPASGFWGFFGYTTTTYVPLLTAQPLLIPAIVGYGVATVGGSLWWKRQVEVAWNKTTSMLNDEYWSWAVRSPEVFVECIVHWSNIEVT